MSAHEGKIAGTMRQKKTRKLALLGVLLACAIALSYLESLVAIPSPVPGIKLGLSNAVTMYCVFFLGPLPALAIALLKSFFVFLTRGATSGALSAAGGLLSVTVMLLARRLGCSHAAVSVFGAVAHNLGQLALAALMLKTSLALWYAPVLILSGVAMGLLTGAVLRLLLPALEKTGLADPEKNNDRKTGV